MSIRNPRLPLLPGYGANPLIGKKSFGVRPVFTSVDKVNMLVDKPEGVNRVPSLYCRKQMPELPTWLMYDKNILHFQAYFQQSLHEMLSASHILRKVDIYFFLEDGTIKVMEPRTDNSGLSQDLNIGREVTFFGKVFKIINCDNFTRVFLNRLGINVPDPLSWPDAVEKAPDNRRPPKHRPFRQFLDFDRQVLRFHGYWDDRSSEFGFIHLLEIHYFLADDTIEIKEELPPNSGIEAGPIFLKRMRLPRKIPSHVEMTGGAPQPSYSPADLTIGAVLNVFGRKVVLTNCDPFTKEYYRVTYGFDSFNELPVPKDESSECVSTNVNDRQLPPWNGYGSYDDSAENCRTGGKFFRRDKMYLPDVNFFVPKEPPAYTDKDMWVGNELVINKHRFRLVAADDYALRYMELHSEEYPMANVPLILDKIRRELASQENKSLVFSELTRGLWDDRERLREGLLHADAPGLGSLPVSRVRQLLRAHRLPINTDLLDCMLQVLEKDNKCNILYEDLMSFLDFQTRPCKLWAKAESQIQEGYVNWSAFLCQLNLDHLLLNKIILE
ncbi:unnamed protein product, partial [Leptidea sinapis]